MDKNVLFIILLLNDLGDLAQLDNRLLQQRGGLARALAHPPGAHAGYEWQHLHLLHHAEPCSQHCSPTGRGKHGKFGSCLLCAEALLARQRHCLSRSGFLSRHSRHSSTARGDYHRIAGYIVPPCWCYLYHCRTGGAGRGPGWHTSDACYTRRISQPCEGAVNTHTHPW